MRTLRFAVCSACALPFGICGTAWADSVVQIPVDSVIDGRSVSTLQAATVVPWTAGEGVDGDGNSDGFVTNAVETVLQTQGKTVGGKVNVALPDDGMFPEDTRHPLMVLHFSNAAPSTSPQTHQVHQTTGAQDFEFSVPQATYSSMYLAITSSEGTGALTITMNYAGGAPATVTPIMLPDYGIGGAAATDPVVFNLISGMHKWNTQDVEGDVTSHTITAIELTPSPTDVMTSIEVKKTNGAHVVFWGATGVATSAVDGGAPELDDARAEDAAPLDAAEIDAPSTSGASSGSASGSASGSVSGGGSGSGTGAAETTTGSRAEGASGSTGSSSAGSSAPIPTNSSGKGCSVSTPRRPDITAGSALLALGFLGARRRRSRG
jgi:hypothetical protein